MRSKYRALAQQSLFPRGEGQDEGQTSTSLTSAPLPDLNRIFTDYHSFRTLALRAFALAPSGKSIQNPTVSPPEIMGGGPSPGSACYSWSAFLRGIFGCGEARLREYGLQRPMTDLSVRGAGRERSSPEVKAEGLARGRRASQTATKPQSKRLAGNQNYTISTPFLDPKT